MLQAARVPAGAVALTTPKGNRTYRLNALVLLGGYLILKQGWSAKRLAGALGATSAGAKFACSWSRSESPESESVMSVQHCWDGLEMAVERSWLTAACVEDDAKLQQFVARYYLRAICFDATWIIPGLLMVSSDPTTVVYDPNPATCKRLLPVGREDAAPAKTSACRGEPAARLSRVSSEAGPRSSTFSQCTLDTVCKEYNENYEDALPCDPSMSPGDVATFLEQGAVGILVRANFDNEDGMKKPSYGDGAFQSFGVEQVNIRVVDTHGGLPKPEDVASLIQVCELFMNPAATARPAVLVHCKGGFGRSVIFAACLAVHCFDIPGHCFDIPGAAFLGWARIARPGAITTRKQECFLTSLKGRADVLRFAKLPPDGIETETRSSPSCSGCALQ